MYSRSPYGVSEIETKVGSLAKWTGIAKSKIMRESVSILGHVSKLCREYLNSSTGINFRSVRTRAHVEFPSVSLIRDANAFSCELFLVDDFIKAESVCALYGVLP